MKYAVIKFDMSNIIAWTIAKREDLEKGISDCATIISWHKTLREAEKNCPRYVIDKHA